MNSFESCCLSDSHFMIFGSVPSTCFFWSWPWTFFVWACVYNCSHTHIIFHIYQYTIYHLHLSIIYLSIIYIIRFSFVFWYIYICIHTMYHVHIYTYIWCNHTWKHMHANYNVCMCILYMYINFPVVTFHLQVHRQCCKPHRTGDRENGSVGLWLGILAAPHLGLGLEGGW